MQVRKGTIQWIEQQGWGIESEGLRHAIPQQFLGEFNERILKTVIERIR
jgi:hypothetical protein